jgi:hypothetical protein
MCDLVARDYTLENKLVSREHRSCSQDSTCLDPEHAPSGQDRSRAVRAPGRISGTSSWTVFRVRELSRSVQGEGRSQTCPYKTGFVGANPVFALERERPLEIQRALVGANLVFALEQSRNDVRRERPARNDVRRERPAQPLEIQSGGLQP